MDADSDYNEVVAMALDLGASEKLADMAARELGRSPEGER